MHAPVHFFHAGVGGNVTSAIMKEKDFQSEDELRKSFNASDFFFDFNNASIIQSPGGAATRSNIASNKFLGTLPGDGVSASVVTMEACSLVQPHVHPRAIESTYFIKGANILYQLRHIFCQCVFDIAVMSMRQTLPSDTKAVRVIFLFRIYWAPYNGVRPVLGFRGFHGPCRHLSTCCPCIPLNHEQAESANTIFMVL
jgi:hypothetical protein